LNVAGGKLHFTSASLVLKATVVAEAGCEWTVGAKPEWLTIAPASGKGTKEIALTAAAASADRSGTLTINGVNTPVTQAAGGGR
jgi:hypothetical protein